MKPVIKKLGMLTAMLLAFLTASAYDFEVDGIYYNIVNESAKEAAVTYRSTSGDSYSGDISIPSSVTKDNVIYSVTSIGARAFQQCSSLTSITIPNGVTSIEENAFGGCHSLTSITIPNSVTSIEKSAFNGCDSLTSITIPNSVTSIEDSAFSYCSSLASISLGTGLTYIGYNVFYGCNIKKAFWLANTPPSKASEVNASINYVANSRYNLKNQQVYPFLSSRFEVDNVVYVPVSPSDRTCDVVDCNYSPTSSDFEIDSIVTNKGVQLKVLNVNSYSFYNNQYINSLKISNAGYIGEQAFYDCDALNKVTVSNNGYIGERAFYGCDALTTVTASNNGYIGAYAFADCNMSDKLEIGENVTTIGYSAFQNNTKLKQLTLPDNVSGLGACAFAGCKELEKASIGKGISVLPIEVFSGCSALPEISIPSNIASIENYAFEGCSSLSDVTIEQSNKETIAENILKIGSNGSSPIFADCPLDEVYIGRKLSYGYSPFYRNTSLRTVTITDAETEIYDNEFYGCSNLQSFSCGDGVTKIGNWAFSGCSAMKSYSSGTHVIKIGTEAFSDCTGLTSFTTLAAVPPTCGTQALDDINKWECTLSVPAESVDDYQAAPQWKEFFFIEEATGKDDTTDIEDVAIDQNCEIRISANGITIDGVADAHVSVYTIDGRLVRNIPEYNGGEIRLAKGIYIVCIGSQSKKIMI